MQQSGCKTIFHDIVVDALETFAYVIGSFDLAGPGASTEGIFAKFYLETKEFVWFKRH